MAANMRAGSALLTAGLQAAPALRARPCTLNSCPCLSRKSSSSARPLDEVPQQKKASAPKRSSRPSTRTEFGQPLPTSHSHLFPPFDVARPFPAFSGERKLPARFAYHSSLAGEAGQEQLTPGITRAEYESRRRRLMDEVEDGAVVVVMGGRVKYMSGQIFYRFRQASNFFYLTGFCEPDSALVLEKSASSPRGFKMTLFVSPRDPGHESWNGPRSGTDGAVDVFGADEGKESDAEGRNLLHYLKGVLPDAPKVYYDPPLPPTIPRKLARGAFTNPQTASPSLLSYLAPPSPTSFDLFSKKTDFETVTKLLSDARRCIDLGPILDSHRLIKSPAELRLMRRAGQIAGLAHNSTMRFSNTSLGQNEWSVQAHFEYAGALLGASRPAYVPVVAGGDRGCIIHYTDNDRPLSSRADLPRGPQGEAYGSLLTMDAGVEYAGYASDITRAWPVALNTPAASDSRRVGFTGPQEDLYSALLRVLKKCTELAVASNGYSLSSLHRRSVELLRVELRDLGFDLGLGDLERVLYPHYLGHFLGLDLHDTPTVSRSTPLKAGTVITIEPGLYIPTEEQMSSSAIALNSKIPKAFRGIGLRIEDDIAIGETDNVILSQEAVKEVQDVLRVCEGWQDSTDRLNGLGHSTGLLGAELEQHAIGRVPLGFD
ncbi:unnamed protein product [Parajaminaea phylloscopi]